MLLSGGRRREGGTRQGLFVGSEAEGSGGSKGRGLALGLFAALPLPLSALAHLHLCQLDVPQHVGVCGGKDKTEDGLIQSTNEAITNKSREADFNGFTNKCGVEVIAKIVLGMF